MVLGLTGTSTYFWWGAGRVQGFRVRLQASYLICVWPVSVEVCAQCVLRRRATTIGLGFRV